MPQASGGHVDHAAPTGTTNRLNLHLHHADDHVYVSGSDDGFDWDDASHGPGVSRRLSAAARDNLSRPFRKSALLSAPMPPPAEVVESDTGAGGGATTEHAPPTSSRRHRASAASTAKTGGDDTGTRAKRGSHGTDGARRSSAGPEPLFTRRTPSPRASVPHRSCADLVAAIGAGRGADDVVMLAQLSAVPREDSRVALAMARKKAVYLPNGLLQCRMCKTKKCTSLDTLAAHYLRRHKHRVDKWADKRKV